MTRIARLNRLPRWPGFLGVLFLATGGSAADRAANFWVTCDLWTPAEARNICAETSAAAAFGILAWFFRE